MARTRDIKAYKSLSCTPACAPFTDSRLECSKHASICTQRASHITCMEPIQAVVMCRYSIQPGCANLQAR